MDAATELTTVEQAASGDEVAFARLIDEHHEPMVRAAYVVVGDVELAREAAQNAWPAQGLVRWFVARPIR